MLFGGRPVLAFVVGAVGGIALLMTAVVTGAAIALCLVTSGAACGVSGYLVVFGGSAVLLASIAYGIYKGYENARHADIKY